MTVRDALREAEARLAAAGVATPRVDAELLLSHAVGTTRGGLYAEPEREVADSWDELVARREAREPLAYVLGEWGFRRLTLKVDRRALVPRPETEVVVERCLELIRPLERPRVLDVGVGSGAIALSVAAEHPGAEVTGIDASSLALELARENAARLGLSLALASHDVSEGLPAGPWDLVVANPPYVRADEIERLAPEVREWEPRQAILDRGQTAAVIRGARTVMRPGGALVLETHWDTARALVHALETAGYADIRASLDLTGIERVVEARWRA